MMPSAVVVISCLALVQGCSNPDSSYVFFNDLEGNRVLVDVCGYPLPVVVVDEVDLDLYPTGRVLGRYTPEEADGSVVELRGGAPGYEQPLSTPPGTWASLRVIYGDQESGIVVPWADLPRGSGYTEQDEIVQGPLEEIVAETKDYACS